MERINTDALGEVFRHLTAAELLRCRCVCRKWRKAVVQMDKLFQVYCNTSLRDLGTSWIFSYQLEQRFRKHYPGVEKVQDHIYCFLTGDSLSLEFLGNTLETEKIKYNDEPQQFSHKRKTLYCGSIINIVPIKNFSARIFAAGPILSIHAFPLECSPAFSGCLKELEANKEKAIASIKSKPEGYTLLRVLVGIRTGSASEHSKTYGSFHKKCTEENILYYEVRIL
jgi:hypothetical protein